MTNSASGRTTASVFSDADLVLVAAGEGVADAGRERELAAVDLRLQVAPGLLRPRPPRRSRASCRRAT